jgi:GT2 family glycosyltransferase
VRDRAGVEALLNAGIAIPSGELTELVRAGALDMPPVGGAPYAAWRALREAETDAGTDAELARGDIDLAALPLISVLMPVHDPAPAFLDAALRSIRGQSHEHWELCVADDASTNPAVTACLARHAEADARVRVLRRRENGHISAATNSALEAAKGVWCAFADHDDALHRHALLRMALAAAEHPEAACIFSDEDRINEEGRRDSPHFKPGFNPELLLACNSVCHLAMCRTDLLRRLGGLREGFEGAQDHDLALRILEAEGPGAFVHTPHVLYHWRMHEGSTSVGLAAKPYAARAAFRAKTEHLARRNIPARVENLPESAFSLLHFALPAPPPLLSLILCLPGASREAAQWTQALASRTGHAKREILVAPTGPPGPTLLRLYGRGRGGEGRLLPPGDTAERARNAAAGEAKGTVLLFVDAFSLPLRADWAEELAAAALWEELGAAGNRRLRADGFLAHAGLAFGREAFFPAFAGLHPRARGYFSQAALPRTVGALSASCICMRREVFLALKGFDESPGGLAVADFCLRLHERGLRCLCTPCADAVGPEEPIVPYTPAFRARWGTLLHAPPYQNPRLDWTPGGWKPRFHEIPPAPAVA